MTYVYKCSSCGKVIEKRVPLSEANSVQICECGNVLQKIITQCNFILLGKGWGKDG